jgi:hypothetical protein
MGCPFDSSFSDTGTSLRVARWDVLQSERDILFITRLTIPWDILCVPHWAAPRDVPLILCTPLLPQSSGVLEHPSDEWDVPFLARSAV